VLDEEIAPWEVALESFAAMSEWLAAGGGPGVWLSREMPGQIHLPSRGRTGTPGRMARRLAPDFEPGRRRQSGTRLTPA